MNGEREAGGDGRLRPCPICGRPAVAAYRPFCSKRCADVDLHRWLAGVYVLPAAEDEGTPSNGTDESA